MPDINLNFIRQGAGAPPIIFVHGFLCRYQDWARQISHFSARHDVIACDLRGHGASPRGTRQMSVETIGGDVAALMKVQDVTGAVLVGHSMGCRVVMEVWRQMPERVAGLVMVDGSRFAEDPLTAVQAVDAAIAANGYAPVVEAMFNSMFFGEPPSWKEEKIAQVLAILETTGLPLFRSMIAWDASRLDPLLSAIDIPLHVIQSTALGPDRSRQALNPGDISPYQQLLVNRVPGTTWESVTAGHFCMMEAFERVNASIEKFLADKIME